VIHAELLFLFGKEMACNAKETSSWGLRRKINSNIINDMNCHKHVLQDPRVQYQNL